MYKDYFLVIDTDIENFQYRIVSLMEADWELLGAPQIVFAPDGKYNNFLYHQAMVK